MGINWLNPTSWVMRIERRAKTGTMFIVLHTFLKNFCLFRATPVAYGSSQAGVESELQLPPTPQLRAMPLSGPGIKAKSSWILVRFVSAEPQGNSCAIYFSCYVSSDLFKNSMRWETSLSGIQIPVADGPGPHALLVQTPSYCCEHPGVQEESLACDSWPT